ncbi:uncharacterized protein LOC121907396 [Scomber scombrus]|uniref:Uncharacterized protein LOC121907396 n=1 Tax=Scomber scombrus TaxID=13677 RepID=A0AAV1NK99_SCOSC
MKTLVIFSLGLAVALGMPPFVPDAAPNPVVTREEQSPLLGDVVPVQGHVVVEDPAPQVRLGSGEQQEKLAPDTDQSPLQDQVKKDSIMEQEVVAKPEAEIELAEKGVMVETEVKVKQEDKVDQELKAEEEVKMERDVKVDPEAKADAEAHLNPEDMAELEVKVKSEPKLESELSVSPDFKVESEVKVEPDVEWEPEVKPQEVQEEFRMEMNHEEKTKTGQEVEERHIDMEEKHEMKGEPVEESELLDDDNMLKEELSDAELSELEKSLRVEFQNPDPDTKSLPEEEGPMDWGNDVLDEEPIMDFQPDTMEEPVQYQQGMPGSPFIDDGPALDIMGQPILPSGDYLPHEEAIMGMDLAKQHDSDHLMMEGEGSEFVREEEFPKDDMALLEEPAMEDSPQLGRADQIGVMPETERRALMQQEVENPVERRGLPKATGWGSCPGVVLERKCYQFFTERKTASDAEFFCQKLYPGGHLASITSTYIHKELVKIMLTQNGAFRRTWIGGLRYLETGCFIWLDGSQWDYADWLQGEPNHTSNKEHCVEMLEFANGKFNDFTCWEPQAFICSHPY